MKFELITMLITIISKSSFIRSKPLIMVYYPKHLKINKSGTTRLNVNLFKSKFSKRLPS